MQSAARGSDLRPGRAWTTTSSWGIALLRTCSATARATSARLTSARTRRAFAARQPLRDLGGGPADHTVRIVGGLGERALLRPAAERSGVHGEQSGDVC